MSTVKAIMASYEKVSFLDSGGTLYIWTIPNQSHADIKLDVDLKTARTIAKCYGIEKLKVRSN
jgi:hypothetical protein